MRVVCGCVRNEKALGDRGVGRNVISGLGNYWGMGCTVHFVDDLGNLV